MIENYNHNFDILYDGIAAKDLQFMPTIWVKDQDTKYQIVSYSNCWNGGFVHIIKGNYVAMISLKELFGNYTFLDGSVCGVEE